MSTNTLKRSVMAADNMQPIASVTGLYRGKFDGLEPLTASTPLTRDEVQRNPIFYEYSARVSVLI